MNHAIKHRAASGTRQSSATTDHIAKELNRYDVYLRDVRGLATGTRKYCIRIYTAPDSLLAFLQKL